jgi:hypothetical protein
MMADVLHLPDLLLQRVEILVLEFEDQFVELLSKVLIDADGVRRTCAINTPDLDDAQTGRESPTCGVLGIRCSCPSTGMRTVLLGAGGRRSSGLRAGSPGLPRMVLESSMRDERMYRAYLAARGWQREKHFDPPPPGRYRGVEDFDDVAAIAPVLRSGQTPPPSRAAWAAGTWNSASTTLVLDDRLNWEWNSQYLGSSPVAALAR